MRVDWQRAQRPAVGAAELVVALDPHRPVGLDADEPLHRQRPIRQLDHDEPRRPTGVRRGVPQPAPGRRSPCAQRRHHRRPAHHRRAAAADPRSLPMCSGWLSRNSVLVRREDTESRRTYMLRRTRSTAPRRLRPLRPALRRLRPRAGPDRGRVGQGDHGEVPGQRGPGRSAPARCRSRSSAPSSSSTTSGCCGPTTSSRRTSRSTRTCTSCSTTPPSRPAPRARKGKVDPAEGQKLLDQIAEIDKIFWETKKA